MREWLQARTPLRVIQTNLQVLDTPRMDPDKLAQDIVQLDGDALVMNVGGIYAWYDTKVDGHTVNPMLPAGRDLLGEILEACHRNGILLFARFDFSKADDSVFLRHPDWFVRDVDNRHRLVAAERPGNWPLLATTCLNAPYRNEAVAVPVLREVMDRYAIDAVFLNAPHFEPCHCGRCKRLYLERYGQALPDQDADLPKDWRDTSFQRNIRMLHDAMRAQDPTLPLILYYGNQPAFSAEVADMLCTESQDVLSRGHGNIPRIHEPAINTKLGCSVEGFLPPFGIIHSSPGMAWRHTGLPDAEYRFWMSQIPAYGGQLWHSLTGFPDTITDKRILTAVADVNRDAGKLTQHMRGMRPASDVLLVWDGGGDAHGWAGLLVSLREQFDVRTADQVTPELLERYAVIILPDTDSLRMNSPSGTPELHDMLHTYAEHGGTVLMTHAAPSEPGGGNGADLRSRLAGIPPDAQGSEPLQAAYVRLEAASACLGLDAEVNALLPLSGNVCYAMPVDPQAVSLATHVPPFSPLEGVGAPPERASLPMARTDWPMVFGRDVGKGKVATLLFGLGRMFRDFGLADHETLAGGLVDWLRGSRAEIHTDPVPGLLMSVWREGVAEAPSTLATAASNPVKPTCGGRRMIHLLNGVGERPLRQCIPLRNLRISVELAPGERVTGAEALLSGLPLGLTHEEGHADILLPALQVWEAIQVEIRLGKGE